MLLFTVYVHMNGHSSSSHDNTETYFDIDNGDGGLGLVEVACHPVHGFWYKIKHQIQIHFIFLRRKRERRERKLDWSREITFFKHIQYDKVISLEYKNLKTEWLDRKTNLFSTGVEEIAQPDNITVVQLPHYLQLTVLQSKK